MPTVNLLEQDRINRERLSKHDFDKNFLVSAGAGAGKTYLTVERAFNMLCDQQLGISPGEIVLITFTRKAAAEMKTRMNKWIRDALEAERQPGRKAMLQRLLNALPEMQISTIHSFCQRVLNDYPLESGVGFAPQYDSEEGGPDSRSERFFSEAWQSGKCPESLNAGISQKIALGAFNQMIAHMNVQPQFIDSSTDDGKALFDKTMAESKRLIGMFAETVGNADPSLFHYTIENAVRAKENASVGVVIAAAGRIAGKGAAARGWMGKTARKGADSARKDLMALLSGEDSEEETLPAFEALFESARNAGASSRRDFMLSHLNQLPEAYRIAAEVAELLPEDDALAELAGSIGVVLHGIVSGEIWKLCQDYVDYCRRNHIVSLNDMLLLTAKLVRECPQVREKLHEKYRTFFVDEYQDTDPIQTDILFAVTADQYDPDWHKCKPRPGSLFLVGDSKQGIYRFRGADISLWQEAEDAMKATGGEIIHLYRNFRSTTEICDAVTKVFGPSGPLAMCKTPYQAEYSEMVSHRGHGPEAVVHHLITCEDEDQGHRIAAEQIARMIQDRVASGQNKYEDFLLLSFFRERQLAYADELRKREISVKFDGALPMDTYLPIQLLNLRVQAVCHPFDESLSFRVLCRCGGITPEEWDLFRMNLKSLPEESDLRRFRDSRALMSHMDELRELLPDTDMNRRVLSALAMLNRDRQLSRNREPCTFLEDLVERTEGLFVLPYDAEEFRNQYAALLQTIDSIRSLNPRQFVEMAELLKASAESEMDRMPSVRADSNFVRLMNLHKAKGLQGKIVIFLPRRVSAPKADSKVRRCGTDTLGWFEITDKDRFTAPKYDPPEWEERKTEEVKFLKAERIRLKYVALTRAEDEAHIFSLSVEAAGKKAKVIKAWEGFDAVGVEAPEIVVPETETEEEASAGTQTAKQVNAESVLDMQQQLSDKITQLRIKRYKRVTPSDADQRNLSVAQADVADQQDSMLQKPDGVPSGMLWGSIIHRAAELIVCDGGFSDESVQESCEQAVKEQIQSELLSRKQRKELALPMDAVTIEAIQADLIGKAVSNMKFMADPDSPFRKLIGGSKLYPEIPFTISARKGQGELYDRLKEIVNMQDEERIEVTGKIDLAIEDKDGSWRIVDYKTDHMLPADHGSKEAFRARLEQQYGSQLEIYKAVLRELTGKPVREATLLSI